jgi:hypothetical protein
MTSTLLLQYSRDFIKQSKIETRLNQYGEQPYVIKCISILKQNGFMLDLCHHFLKKKSKDFQIRLQEN